MRAGVSSGKRYEDVVASSSALILHDRPANLPAKSTDEETKHKQEYEQMVEAAKKRGEHSSDHMLAVELKFIKTYAIVKLNCSHAIFLIAERQEAKIRKKQLQQQIKTEERLAHATKIWLNDVLPKWNSV